MIDDVRLSVSTIVAVCAYVRPCVCLRNGRIAESAPWLTSMMKCPSASSPISFRFGWMRAEVASDGPAAWSTAGVESAMTLQWYTKCLDAPARHDIAQHRGDRFGVHDGVPARAHALAARGAEPPRARRIVGERGGRVRG